MIEPWFPSRTSISAREHLPMSKCAFHVAAHLRAGPLGRQGHPMCGRDADCPVHAPRCLLPVLGHLAHAPFFISRREEAWPHSRPTSRAVTPRPLLLLRPPLQVGLKILRLQIQASPTSPGAVPSRQLPPQKESPGGGSGGTRATQAAQSRYLVFAGGARDLARAVSCVEIRCEPARARIVSFD